MANKEDRSKGHLQEDNQDTRQEEHLPGETKGGSLTTPEVKLLQREDELLDSMHGLNLGQENEHTEDAKLNFATRGLRGFTQRGNTRDKSRFDSEGSRQSYGRDKNLTFDPDNNLQRGRGNWMGPRQRGRGGRGGSANNFNRPQKNVVPLFRDIELFQSPRVDGSRSIALEGCKDENEIVEFKPYVGECHPPHIKKAKTKPRLKAVLMEEDFPASVFFVGKFCQQLMKLKEQYSSSIHQNFRFVVRFGYIYLYKWGSWDLQETPVWAFNEIADDGDRSSQIKRSFIPGDIAGTENQFIDYLKNSGFQEMPTDIGYRLTVAWSSEPWRTLNLRLDEKFKCIDIIYESTKWISVDIKRCKENVMDIRFVLESYNKPDPDALLEKLKGKVMLGLDSLNRLVVNDEFRGRIQFVRYKITKTFAKETKDSPSDLDSGIEVELTTVVEHASERNDGTFALVKEPRHEAAIKIRPELDSIFNTEKMMEFLRRFLPFCCTLEEKLITK